MLTNFVACVAAVDALAPIASTAAASGIRSSLRMSSPPIWVATLSTEEEPAWMRAFTASAQLFYVLRALEGRPGAWYDSCVAESQGPAAGESANPAEPESRIS